jgi:DNA repair exonuclease SbcCD ATPase subunit
MNEETKNVEEVIKEINPIDEYLNNYKEQKLAEFCVQKDKEIENRKNERQRLVEQIAEQKHKVEEYDKCFSSVNELYKKIKTMPVDDYLNLYNKFVDDVSNRNLRVTTITTSNPYTTSGSIFG